MNTPAIPPKEGNREKFIRFCRAVPFYLFGSYLPILSMISLTNYRLPMPKHLDVYVLAVSFPWLVCYYIGLARRYDFPKERSLWKNLWYGKYWFRALLLFSMWLAVLPVLWHIVSQRP